MNKPNVVIVGMARSGTSMTARMFAQKGYFVGNVWSRGSTANPLGYYEATALVEMNVSLLRAVGFQYHNTWAYEPPAPDAIRALRGVKATSEHKKIVDFYDDHAPWVWKDVRLCFTLPVWLQVLDLDKIRFIIVRRRVKGIYHSIKRNKSKKNGKLSLSGACDLMERHVAAARKALDDVSAPYVELNYEECFTSPEKVASILTNFTGVEFIAQDLGARKELNHDTYRDRILSALRRLLERPRLLAVKAKLKCVVPSSWIRWAFPENEYRD